MQDNLIWGARTIGKTIGKSERKTFHLLEKGRLPAHKAGGQWVAREDQLKDPATWPRDDKAAE